MMQSQGLGALMPQGAQQMAPQQQMPPMDPQRLAAATNLVSNDAERQVLDPRTLALIKYKDAVAAMQAADELMAASQPAPTPPTVAERVQQSAQEGITGLASRLGAGIQQQGGNMQAEQMQQAMMSGGLPQLPAPNMAGMAQGGIVGYQDGGDIESAELEQLTQQLIQEGVPPEEARNEARLRLRLPLPGLPRVPNLLPDLTAPARAAARVAGSAYDNLPDAFGGGRGEDFGRQASSPGAVPQGAPFQGSMSDEEIADFTQRRQPSAEGGTERLPSSTYGMGDRTGSTQLPDNMLGGLSNILRSLLPSAPTDSRLSEREPLPESARSGAYTGPTSAERRAITAERTEGSLRRMFEQPEQNAEKRRAERSLRQNLASDGLTREEIDRVIAAQRLPEEELESAEFLPSETQESFSGLPDVLDAITQDPAQPPTSDGDPVRRIPENELEQIAAEIESDPNAFERLASWVVENPYDAISMGLIAVPGIGLAGGLSMRIGGALARSPAVRRAIQSLYTKPNPRGPKFDFDEATNTFSRVSGAGPARVGAPERVIAVGSGVAGTGMMLGRGGDGEGLASLSTGPTAPVSAEQASAQTLTPGTRAQFPLPPPPSGTTTPPMSDVDRLIAQLETETMGAPPGVTTAPAAEAEGGLGALRSQTNLIRDRNLDPDFVENTRLGVEQRAREAYAIPQETRDLYQARIDALDRPMFTPQEERSRKLRALLSGLASSNLIAQGGPAASRAVAQVSDAIREDSTARAEQQFELASSLMGMDMQASQQAFSAGLEATTTAMNQQGVALQMAISTLTAADNREAASQLQQSVNRLESLKIMIDAAQNGQANAVDVQRNVGTMIRAINDDIVSLRATALPNTPLSAELESAIKTLENIRQAYETVFNATLGASGYTVPEVSSGGGGGQFNSVSNEDLLRRLGGN